MSIRPDPVQKHCTKCGATTTLTRYMWRRIGRSLQCHKCKSLKPNWSV